MKNLITVVALVMIVGGVVLMVCSACYEELAPSWVLRCGIPLGLLSIIVGVTVIGVATEKGR